MVGKLLHNQKLPFICPDPLIGPLRGADKTHDNKMKIAAVTVIRLALAFGIFKAAEKMKSDHLRTSALFGGLLSAPAAGFFWSAKLLQNGAREFKRGLIDHSLRKVGLGAGSWVLGCIAAQTSQTLSYNGYRWGAVEVINHRLTKDIEYRGWKGY